MLILPDSRNYYINLAKVAGDDIMPHYYKYVNMFPESDSSTGRFSELLVPESYRLQRSNADPKLTLDIIIRALDIGECRYHSEYMPLIIGGLPILHLMFMKELENSEDNVRNYVKNHGICLYGGESPTIQERLELYSVYS